MPHIDAIQKITGSFGRYQLGLCILVFASKFLVAFHQIAIVFLAPKVSFVCIPDGIEKCPCDKPKYDTSIFTRTIITEWNLICDRRWYSSFNQTIFQLGVLLGSVFFGMAADSYGRRKPLLISVIIQLVAGIAAAYVPEYWTFTCLRFLIGAAIGGTMVTSFVIVMEFVGTKYREVVSALYQVPFNLGHLLLPAFAYFLRDFSDFQLAISVPAVLLLTYFAWVPETPRWLIAVKRTDEAIEILERVAKINKRPTENIKTDIDAYQAMVEQHHRKKGNILDLFRTPNLRKNILAMAFNWLACSYCFYGVSQYIGQLSGDAFINVAASASVILVGTFLSIPLMKALGRRTIVIIFQFACTICLLIMAVIPEGVASVVMASVGTVCSFVVFIVVYLYCTEMFPTVVRNAALGFSSMTCRVGSMVAPFVVDLRTEAVWLPPVVFAVLPLLAGCVTFLLPETKGCKLMTTLEEGEEFGNNFDDERRDNTN